MRLLSGTLSHRQWLGTAGWSRVRLLSHMVEDIHPFLPCLLHMFSVPLGMARVFPFHMGVQTRRLLLPSDMGVSRLTIATGLAGACPLLIPLGLQLNSGPAAGISGTAMAGPLLRRPLMLPSGTAPGRPLLVMAGVLARPLLITSGTAPGRPLMHMAARPLLTSAGPLLRRLLLLPLWRALGRPLLA